MTGFSPPEFGWGRRVRAAADLFNDGSYPDLPAEALLVESGEVGEIVQVGSHLETKRTVYLVEFASGRILGVLQHEILPFESAADRSTP